MLLFSLIFATLRWLPLIATDAASMICAYVARDADAMLFAIMSPLLITMMARLRHMSFFRDFADFRRFCCHMLSSLSLETYMRCFADAFRFYFATLMPMLLLMPLLFAPPRYALFAVAITRRAMPLLDAMSCR